MGRDDDDGNEIPRTVSEKGSLNPPGRTIAGRSSSKEDNESSFKCEADLLAATPMLDGFLRKTFDPGLSTVDADDPETRDGVRVVATTSSLGSRDEENCREVFDKVEDGGERGDSTVGVEPPARVLTDTEVFCTGTR